MNESKKQIIKDINDTIFWALNRGVTKEKIAKIFEETLRKKGYQARVM